MALAPAVLDAVIDGGVIHHSCGDASDSQAQVLAGRRSSCTNACEFCACKIAINSYGERSLCRTRNAWTAFNNIPPCDMGKSRDPELTPTSLPEKR
jgi:hypothetical protein